MRDFRDFALLGAFLIFAFVAVWGYTSYRSISRTHHEFPQRAMEVVPIIKDVYRYEHKKRSWPNTIEDATTLALPPKWEYHPSEDNGPPFLCLPGPFHMYLSYIFSSDEERQDTSYQGWSCNSGTIPEEITRMNYRE